MEKGEKKQKIQWDEVTIAEHDKERGSRQKIDEAPTPYRYQSESDQSECESSDAESLAKRQQEDEEVAATGVPVQRSGKKKKNVLFNNNPNKISDSWETINAKLQYEKHLQDVGNGGAAGQPLNGEFSNSVQRREFYQHRGASSDSNIAGQGAAQHSPKVSLAGAGKIFDLQTNFGEMVHPTHSAPAAFSPQFTRKDYRQFSKGGKGGGAAASLASASAEGEADGERDEAHTSSSHPATTSQTPAAAFASSSAACTGAAVSPKAFSPDKPPKTVFIRSQSQEVPSAEVGKLGGLVVDTDAQDTVMMTSGGSASGDESTGDGTGNKKQFLNKRAGHYNEYKVLQAMRAKLAAETEEEDEED